VGSTRRALGGRWFPFVGDVIEYGIYFRMYILVYCVFLSASVVVVAALYFAAVDFGQFLKQKKYIYVLAEACLRVLKIIFWDR